MTVSVRHWLRQRTADIHQELHAHSLLGCLVHPGLALEDYLGSLRVLHAAFSGVEAARSSLGVFSGFALCDDVSALARDARTSYAPRHGRFEALSRGEVLGGLYVMHGSAFGGRVICANVARQLPDAPRAFFGRERPKAAWPALLATLEAEGADGRQRVQIEAGAARAFACVRTAADQAKCLESLSP